MDDRGSKLQRDIFQLVRELYPIYEVVYEFDLVELGQRLDIFIPVLGVAFEIDGIQHFKSNSFFFKDEVEWNRSVMLDTRKEKYLSEHGIKLVRIPYNTKIREASDLKKVIDEIPYPEQEYTFLQTVKDSTKAREDKQREYRKMQYAKFKKNK